MALAAEAAAAAGAAAAVAAAPYAAREPGSIPASQQPALPSLQSLQQAPSRQANDVSLPLAQVSRNSIENLTRDPSEENTIPFREKIQTLPPRLTPRDPSEPRDAPEGERKFAISGAKKSKSLKNCSLCAAKKTPNPTHIGIEPPTTSKVKTLPK